MHLRLLAQWRKGEREFVSVKRIAWRGWSMSYNEIAPAVSLRGGSGRTVRGFVVARSGVRGCC